LHENRGWCLFRGWQKLGVFFPIWSLDAFATGLGDFLGFGTAKHASGFARFAPAFFFVTDLCVEEIANDAATGERSCEPNAEAHHATDRNRARDAINGSLKKVKQSS